jgi:hypothetical protein
LPGQNARRALAVLVVSGMRMESKVMKVVAWATLAAAG